MITKQLLEHIEGEASVFFDIKDEKVEFSTITFPHFRGMENILEGKNVLDALVIAPRVCGICGHSHLMATTRAIEDVYKNIKITQKAKNIREFTLIMEIVQNHFKWLYMVIIPQLNKLLNKQNNPKPLKGAYASSIISKAIAVFGGQWPHSSYMMPGGVSCDPTYVEVLQAQSFVKEVISFFEKECLGVGLKEFLEFESCKDFNSINSDISELEKNLIEADMHKKGFAHDRFLVVGKHSFTNVSKLKHTRSFGVDEKYIGVEKAYSPQEQTYAKNALYKGEYFETGPLGRMMSISFKIVKNMHRRYKDSAYSRVMARVFEMAYLLEYSLKLLKDIDIRQQSMVEIEDIAKLNGSGVGVVEAPRGPLVHKIEVEEGIIKKYEIITPTQFNIGSSTKEKPTPVQLAMKGTTQKEALFIFRTFDVCSVCTTH